MNPKKRRNTLARLATIVAGDVKVLAEDKLARV